MDPNNLSKARLAGLRTFATDREGKNNSISSSDVKEEVAKPTESVSIPKPPISRNGKDTASLPIPPRKNQEKKWERKPIIKNDSALQKIIADEMKETVVNENIVVEEKKPIKEPADMVTPILAAAKTTHANPEKEVHIEGEEYEAATIITDTKKNRFHLFSATIQSIKDWFKDLKKTRAAKKAPKYTVPEVSRRKGLVQKATSNTAIATSADYENLADRIKQRQANEQKQSEVTVNEDVDSIYEKPYEKSNLEKEEKLPTPPPSSNEQKESGTEIIENVIEEPKTEAREITENSYEQPTSVTENKEEEEVSADEKIETEELLTNEQHQHRNPNSPRWSTDEWSSLENRPIQKDDNVIKKEVRENKDVLNSNIDVYTAQINQGPVIPPPSNKKRKQNIFFETNTNLLSFIISAIILFIFLAIGLGLIWYQNKTNNTYSSVIKDYTGILEQKTDFLYDPMSSKDQFIKVIIDKYMSSSNQTTQFAISTTPDHQNVVRPNVILDFIDFDLNNDFKRSISQLYFGSEEEKNPFLALKVTDQTVALAGMLSWENNIHEDLAELFKLKTISSTATTTDSPAISTSTQNNMELKFVDGTLSGVDVRVLKNENGEEEIIYGFVKPNIVIITTNSRSFGRLTEMVK